MPDKKDKPPTMNDVAKRANVTQTTVSYVINGTARISPEVTKRVRKAIDSLGYEPNALAKSLKKKATSTVGIIVPDIANSFYSSIACAAESILAKAGYISFISSTFYGKDIEKLYISSLLRHNVAGVITYPLFDSSLYELLYKHNIPAVLLDGVIDRPEVQSIYVDSLRGGKAATEYLIKKGRRRIAFAGEPFVIQALSDRFAGYELALSAAGLSSDQTLHFIEEREYDKFEMGYELGGRILKSDADGIFAANDHIAYGILRRLTEAGIKVPRDINLVGFDNTSFSMMAVPSLTTVAQPVTDMAEMAANFLLSIIREHKNPGPSIMLMPELIVRET